MKNVLIKHDSILYEINCFLLICVDYFLICCKHVDKCCFKVPSATPPGAPTLADGDGSNFIGRGLAEFDESVVLTTAQKRQLAKVQNKKLSSIIWEIKQISADLIQYLCSTIIFRQTIIVVQKLKK